MAFWLRLCLGLAFLAPSLAPAQDQPRYQLEIPGQGGRLSGIGIISGWKCETEGEITIVFNDDDPEEDAIPATYGFPRNDTEELCGDTNNGFYSFFNWAILGDGTHIAAAYDNGKKFDSSKFEVATLGEEFVEDANTDPFPLRILDFPQPGEEAEFEWNESTQHLELLSVASTSPEHLCEDLKIPPGPQPPTPLLLPPPLPCPKDETSYQGDRYLIRFDPGFTGDLPIVCEAPRGLMQVEIQEGRFSASSRAPPDGGLVRVSGEVCAKDADDRFTGLFLGGWSVDGGYKGYFTGSLADLDGIRCPPRWEDTAGCTGDLLIQPLPKQ